MPISTTPLSLCPVPAYAIRFRSGTDRLSAWHRDEATALDDRLTALRDVMIGTEPRRQAVDATDPDGTTA